MVSLLLLSYGTDGWAQSGLSVYHQHFGQGENNPTTLGPALSPEKTSYNYHATTCPKVNSYTIVRRVPYAGCFNGEWSNIHRDNTVDMILGNMMLINDTTHVTSRLVYVDTVSQPLCVGTDYVFSTAFINVDKEINCSTSFPYFALIVENENGQKLFSDTTSPGLRFAAPDPYDSYFFSTFSLPFTMIAGVNKVVLKVIVLPTSGNCGEDFAIDDVKLVAAGPRVEVSLSNPTPITVKAVCFADSNTNWVSIVGDVRNVPSNYTVALQWQQSTDEGRTWVDIPGATNYGYSRNFNSPDTFLFRLTVAEESKIGNINCRVVSNTRRVEVDGIPSDYIISTNSPVCSGSELKFEADGRWAAFKWTGPNGFSETSPFPHIFFSQLSDSGMYYVEITSFGGCKAKDSLYVTIIGTDVHAWPDTAVCKGARIQLNASTGLSYQWTPATGLSNTTIAKPIATPAKTTVYTVTVTDRFGCSDTATSNIIVRNRDEAKAIIDAGHHLCRSEDSLVFISKSTGNLASLSWDFGNGIQSTDPNPPVQYYLVAPNTRNYMARLSILDTSGCADTAYHIIEVADNCYIALPTAFTPNGDGKNDYLYPLNAYKATDLQFSVFTRNGQRIFETRDWTKKWDGKLGGIEQATGVYVWMLSYIDARGKRVFQKGTTLLMR